MSGSREFITKRFIRYRNNEGRPTCSLYVGTGDACPLLRTKKFGQVDVCALDHDTFLERYTTGTKSIVPGRACLLWTTKQLNEEK